MHRLESKLVLWLRVHHVSILESSQDTSYLN